MIANDYNTLTAESGSSRFASVSAEETYFIGDIVDDVEAYNKRHGGPFDRGTADSWYGRGRNPHMFTGDSYAYTPAGDSTLIEEKDMRPDELRAYNAGYAENEADPSMRKF